MVISVAMLVYQRVMELDDMTPRIREMALNVDECGGFLNGL